MTGDTGRGLYGKFRVTRSDGQSAPGAKHDGCDYFVLDITHDPHAIAALCAYSASCEAAYPQLAADLLDKARRATERLIAPVRLPAVDATTAGPPEWCGWCDRLMIACNTETKRPAFVCFNTNCADRTVVLGPDTPSDDPPRAADATPLDATDRARKDWRFIHEAIVSDENRRDVETLTDDIGVAMARTRASLEILGRKGSAGIWLENESLLAVRRVLEEVVDLRGEVSSLTGALEEARRISQLAIAYRDADTRFQNAVNARDPMGADDATDLGDATRAALFDAIDDAAAARPPEMPE